MHIHLTFPFGKIRNSGTHHLFSFPISLPLSSVFMKCFNKLEMYLLTHTCRYPLCHLEEKTCTHACTHRHIISLLLWDKKPKIHASHLYLLGTCIHPLSYVRVHLYVHAHVGILLCECVVNALFIYVRW